MAVRRSQDRETCLTAQPPERFVSKGSSESLRITQVPRFQLVAGDADEAVFATARLA